MTFFTHARSVILLLAVSVFLFALGGCGDDRKPMPMLTIVIMADADQYLLNQQRMNLAGLEAELRRSADENRRSMTGHVRAYVYIDTERGVDYYRTQDVVNLCTSMGYTNVISNSTGMK